MRKSGLAVLLTSVFLISGCASPSSSFLDSKISPSYADSKELDDKFLKAIKSAGKTNRVFTDEDYIRYGKSICTLLDEADNPEIIVLESRGEDRVVSDAAIQIYCPEYDRGI